MSSVRGGKTENGCARSYSTSRPLLSQVSTGTPLVFPESNSLLLWLGRVAAKSVSAPQDSFREVRRHPSVLSALRVHMAVYSEEISSTEIISESTHC